MQVVYECCAGLDVHKKNVVACILTAEGREIRTFGTMTEELLGLLDWLQQHGCRVVAMESTGVYWKPIYNLLESADFEALVVNAQHIKAVPGRKTDVKDAEWIADLLQHGLLRGSFIPDRPQRELRELVRYRRSLVQEKARETARLQKVLEGANIKLASVATDVLGVSGRAILKALVEEASDPVQLASLARGRLKAKQPALEQALRGLVGSHQRLLLTEQLSHIEDLEARIARLSEEIQRRLAPCVDALVALDTIPGVARRTAEEILAEIGREMARFPSQRHLASWAKVCPGNHRSAGKSRSGHTGHGNPWLRSTLVEAARAAAHTKNTYLGAQYRRLARRIGDRQAILAVAHSILVIVYHLLSRGTTYSDLGATYFDEKAREAVARSATRRLEAVGYQVQLTDLRAA